MFIESFAADEQTLLLLNETRTKLSEFRKHTHHEGRLISSMRTKQAYILAKV